jgi:hypothetical protein
LERKAERIDAADMLDKLGCDKCQDGSTHQWKGKKEGEHISNLGRYQTMANYNNVPSVRLAGDYYNHIRG